MATLKGPGTVYICPGMQSHQSARLAYLARVLNFISLLLVFVAVVILANQI